MKSSRSSAPTLPLRSARPSDLALTFRFCTLDGTGRPCGQVLTGKVQKIRRAGRKMVVDLYIPTKSCTHTYYAAEIYYHGRPREGLI